MYSIDTAFLPHISIEARVILILIEKLKRFQWVHAKEFNPVSNGVVNELNER